MTYIKYEILTFVCTHETITILKRGNKSITHRSFLIPLGSLSPVLPWSSNPQEITGLSW